MRKDELSSAGFSSSPYLFGGERRRELLDVRADAGKIEIFPFQKSAHAQRIGHDDRLPQFGVDICVCYSGERTGPRSADENQYDSIPKRTQADFFAKTEKTHKPLFMNDFILHGDGYSSSTDRTETFSSKLTSHPLSIRTANGRTRLP